jgi:fatty-acyl-CoA synthase
MMESYRRGAELELLDTTLGQQLRHTAARFPGRPAIISRHQNVRLTWGELDARVDEWAAGLAGMGLRAGDRVGVWSPNCVEWVILQLASARAGMTLVNVNPAYRSHELRYVIRQSRMKALFLWEQDQRANYREILEAAVDGHPGVTDMYFGPGFRWPAAGAVQANPLPDDVVNVQYTSGTTGNPKGVLLTHRNILNNGLLIGRQMKMTPEDLICVPVPLYHCFGAVIGVMTALVHGCGLLLPNWSFDARTVLEAIHHERATAVYGVPTMFIAELNDPEFAQYDLTSLRTGIMAGAPCPIEVMKKVAGLMHCRELTIAYGQTESSPVITMSAADDPLDVRVSTVGTVLPETELKIVSAETGQTVPTGVQGELCSRGYLVMKSYDGEPEATAEAIDVEGWLHTGDLAVMREDGNIRITGRAKDMIIRGGENISPREIEEFLHEHHGVAEVQVVGLPDERLGETIAAWVRLRNGENLTAEELRQWCRGQIAHFKIPQHVRFVDSFPTTASGKIQKFRIREIEIEKLGLQQAAMITTA